MSTTTTQKARRRWVPKVAMLAFSFAFSFLLLELGLRATGMDAARVWEPHPVLGWQHVPGARQHFTDEGDGQIVINSLGYRDRERKLEKTPGTYRIALFGDSMTEGVQVNLDQTYCYRLQDQLCKEGMKAEVLNFAVNGYGPIQELLSFRQEGPRYKPDCVLLSLFLDNDIADCHPALTTHNNGPPFIASRADGVMEFDFSKAEESYKDYHREPIYTIRKFSATYRQLSEQRMRLRQRVASKAGGSTIQRRYLLYQDPPQAAWNEAWEITSAVIVEFANEAKRQGCKFGIVSVPAAQVVRPATWQQILDTNPAMADSQWDLHQPDNWLRTLTNAHGIALLQPGESYMRSAEETPLFIGHVGHFTSDGHRVMADAIDGFLHSQVLSDNEHAAREAYTAQ